VVFVDIIGSTELVSKRAPADVVELLNRFFTVIVDEVNDRNGLVNKFEGDATLAIFARRCRHAHRRPTLWPLPGLSRGGSTMKCPSARSALALPPDRWWPATSAPSSDLSTPSSGDTVNEAARLCDLAKSTPQRVLASATAVQASDAGVRRCWELGEEKMLRGRDEPTRLAVRQMCLTTRRLPATDHEGSG
jgi:adenylate cyclase